MAHSLAIWLRGRVTRWLLVFAGLGALVHPIIHLISRALGIPCP